MLQTRMRIRFQPIPAIRLQIVSLLQKLNTLCIIAIHGVASALLMS